MTTAYNINLKCPCCGHEFQSTSLMSTNNFGAHSTDFHERAAGDQPLPLYIHTCPSCGYTGYIDDFKDTQIDKTLKEVIRQRLTPLVKDEIAFPGRRYEYAAWIAKWRNMKSVVIGDLYLKAAWCCDDDRKEEEEKHYRRQAIEYFEKALQEKEIPEEDIAVYTYLIGELYRRIGDVENSILWFDRVPELAGENPKNQWLISLALQQKTNPKEFFDRK